MRRAVMPRLGVGPRRAARRDRPALHRLRLAELSDDGSLASNESPLGASARVVTAITGFQLRLVLERGNPPSPTANHASCVGVSQPKTSATTAARHTISGTCGFGA